MVFTSSALRQASAVKTPGFVVSSQSIHCPLPLIPMVHPSAPRYASHSRSLTKLPPKLDQRKEAQGPCITRWALVWAISLQGQPFLDHPCRLCGIQQQTNLCSTQQANSKSELSDILSTAHSPEALVQLVLKANLSALL